MERKKRARVIYVIYVRFTYSRTCFINVLKHLRRIRVRRISPEETRLRRLFVFRTEASLDIWYTTVKRF